MSFIYRKYQELQIKIITSQLEHYDQRSAKSERKTLIPFMFDSEVPLHTTQLSQKIRLYQRSLFALKKREVNNVVVDISYFKKQKYFTSNLPFQSFTLQLFSIQRVSKIESVVGLLQFQNEQVSNFDFQILLQMKKLSLKSNGGTIAYHTQIY
ncbi:Hypothetical_protein [Hexamita inflata]|uniref:Hypothetical_protein n=1 Tax=Hexamita inflata TaxID=28002 RepID=A0AA86U6P8_9EUKA|nr:Hypothetical protein HINF_LOCUS27557 [Hexamita inflata]